MARRWFRAAIVGTRWAAKWQRFTSGSWVVRSLEPWRSYDDERLVSSRPLAAVAGDLVLPGAACRAIQPDSIFNGARMVAAIVRSENRSWRRDQTRLMREVSLEADRWGSLLLGQELL